MKQTHIISIYEWLNSGEYLADIDELCTEIMKSVLTSENEAQTASIFETELYFLIRTKTGTKIDFLKEHNVDNVIHTFGNLSKKTSGKGRLDAVVNNLIIEYKHHSKLVTDEQRVSAINQTIDYLLALYKSTGIKYKAILTDGLKISFFSFVEDEVRYSSLSNLNIKAIDTVIRAILSNDKKQFVPKNVLKDFSINFTVPTISKAVAESLYDALKNKATLKTKMLYEEWKSLMHLSISDNGKGNDIAKRRKDLSLIFSDKIDNPELEYKALYALQTTYAIIVKLIACKVIDKLEYNNSARNYHDLTEISPEEMQNFFEKMEDGYSYKSCNINNLLEGDFFSWYSDKKQWSATFWKVISEVVYCIDQYSSFSFNITYNPIDIFKDLYMSIIPKSIRHSMGEYFTPEWLADYVVTEGLAQIKNTTEWKAIDPCCGSGIFLISLIKHIVGDTNIQELTDEEKNRLKVDILNRVFGIDINPLSVLSARVGYYLALQPFGELRDLEIPVYLGDSAIIPNREIIDGISCYKYSVTNIKRPFEVILPERFVKMKNFGKIMSRFQAFVNTNDSKILYSVLEDNLSKEEKNQKK